MWNSLPAAVSVIVTCKDVEARRRAHCAKESQFGTPCAQSREHDQRWNPRSAYDPWAKLPEGHHCHHSKLRGERSADQWLWPCLAPCTRGTRGTRPSPSGTSGCSSGGVRSPTSATALADVHRGWAGQADAQCHQSDIHCSRTCDDDDVSTKAEGLVVEDANMIKLEGWQIRSVPVQVPTCIVTYMQFIVIDIFLCD